MKKDLPLLNTVLESIEDGINVLDKDLTIIYANKTLKNWYSDRIPLEGKKCFHVYFNRKEPCEPCPVLKSFKTTRREREERLTAGVLDASYLEVSSCPIMDEETGVIIGAVEQFSDISARKKREGVQREKETNLMDILESLGEGVITTDQEGLITSINGKAQQMTACPSSRCIGRPLAEVFILAKEGDVEAPDPVHILHDDKDNMVLHEYMSLVAMDGTKRQITFTAIPLKYHGNTKGIGLVFSDITKIDTIQRALKKSEEEKTLILNSISETCVLYDKDLKIVWMNKRAQELAGSSFQGLASSPCYSILFGRESACEECPMEKVKDGLPHEGEIVTKDGSIFLVKGYPVFSHGGLAGFIEMGMDITEKKKTEMALLETKYKLEKLHETALQMSRTREEHKIYQLMVEAATKILQFSLCSFYLKKGDLLVMKASSPGFKCSNLSLKEETEKYFKEKILHIEDLKPEELEFPLKGYQSLLCVPVGDWGVFQVASKKSVFSKGDIKLLEILTTHTAEAIRSIYSGSRLEYLSCHDDLTQLFNRGYLEKQINLLDNSDLLPITIIIADINGLKLVNDTYGYSMGDRLLVTVARGLRKACRSDDIITRWGGDEFVIFLPSTSKKQSQKICNRIQEEFKEIMVEGIPVQLALGSATKMKEEEDILRVLKEAEDLMNKQKLTEVCSTRGKIISTLLKTLGEKSYETEEHAWRMQKMAIDVGDKIGLPPSELDRLSLLLTLHDMGKITIPQEILTKPGRLSEEEWEIIKKHPETGARIATSTEEFSHVAEEILSHHERWDGKGYPQGLKEQEIPLLARLASIVDAYDVMTHYRSYKEAMGQEEAIEELRSCAGTQFDPQLVDVFIKVITSS